MGALEARAVKPVSVSCNRPVNLQRVLLVDDEPRVCRSMTALLRLNGWSVVVARNGRSALEVLGRDQAFALVLSDIDMPVLDGFGLARQIDLCYPELRIVLMTGSPDHARDELSLTLPVCVIDKPPTAAQIQGILTAAQRSCEGSLIAV